MDTSTLVIATIVIIILFIMLLFNVEILNYISNLFNTTSGTNTTPGDCPDYWVKYQNHKDSSTDASKYGCYINSKLQPDVVYNGGTCNYINGYRTNFGTMPNYCDMSQNPASGNELNISNAQAGIQLIDGWQSFFKGQNLPAMIAISPQQNQSWNPNYDDTATGSAAAGGTVKDNDNLYLYHVGLYAFNSVLPLGSGVRQYKVSAIGDINHNLLIDAKSFTGPSYIMTGLDSLNGDSLIINDNYGYLSSELNSPDNALLRDIGKFYKNLYKCGDTYTVGYTGVTEDKTIECPTTWTSTISNLTVDTSYVLVYLDMSPSSASGATPAYPDTNDKGHVVSIYDKLTKSSIKKGVATTIDASNIEFTDDVGLTKKYYEFLTTDGSTAVTESFLTSNNRRLNYIEFYIPAYNPNTSGTNQNTVAGYSMDVLDSLSYCQKKIWASKNDIQWSGITDNWTLDMCNENDFSAQVNVDVSFNIYSNPSGGCTYMTIDDASAAAQTYIAAMTTAYGAANADDFIGSPAGADILDTKYGLTGNYTADGSGAQAGYYIQTGNERGTTCDINNVIYDSYNAVTTLNYADIL